VVAAVTCRLTGARATATTAGPDGRLAAEAAATEEMAAWGKAGVGEGPRCATPLTAHASTKGAIVATLNAECRFRRIARWRGVARQGRLNLETPKSVDDPHTTAGSSACAFRRWRAMCPLPALGGDGGVVVAVPAGRVDVVADGVVLGAGERV
jgi:hypothetical protein